MTVTYQDIPATEFTQEYILRLNDDNTQSFIPKDPANADYQAYLNKDTLPSELSTPTTPQAGA